MSMYMDFLITILLALLASPATGFAAAQTGSSEIDIINTNREKVGKATFRETPNGVLIELTLAQNAPGVAPGTHALHIHEVGQCEPPFKTAGGHYNPLGNKHGFLDKSGYHIGDLPNIHVPANGSLSVEFFVPGLTLTSGKTALLDPDGSALVLHAGRDDYRTDPAGDSGDRVACGVIEKPDQK